MENLPVYFLGQLAFNITAALVTFGIAYWLCRRKNVVVPWARALAALLLGWVAGSAIVFMLHVLLAMLGLNLEQPPIGIIVSLSVMYGTMYLLLTWMRPKTNVPSSLRPNA